MGIQIAPQVNNLQPLLSAAVYWSQHLDQSVGDLMFRGDEGRNEANDEYYVAIFSELRAALAARGIHCATFDRFAPGEAGAIIFIDLPRGRGEFEAVLRRMGDNCLKILVCMESPVGHYELFSRFELRQFDLAFTYCPALADGGAVRHHRIAAIPNLDEWRGGPPADEVPFEKRRLLALLNSNKFRDFRTPSQWPLASRINGWRMPGGSWSMLWHEGYGIRRRLVAAAEHRAPGQLDTYGPGWVGRRASWHRLLPQRRYLSARGAWAGSRIELFRNYKFSVAIENFIGNRGYVSEKLFYPMLAGSVPVYLGDADIAKDVPGEAFIDVRDFRSFRELLDHLSDMSPDRWNAHREAGRQFLLSPRADAFRASSLANAMADAIRSRLAQVA